MFDLLTRVMNELNAMEMPGSITYELHMAMGDYASYKAKLNSVFVALSCGNKFSAYQLAQELGFA